MSPQPQISLGGGTLSPQIDGRVFTPDEHLFPTLSNQDRHPSAPLLHSMLSSGIMPTPHINPATLPHHANKDINNIIQSDDEISQRGRSWSMPVNTNRPPLPPQISISSPDEPQDLFCKFV